MKLFLYLCFILLVFSGGCKRKDAPAVKTLDPTSVTRTSATIGGEIISQGDGEVIAKGICRSTADNPTLQDSLTAEGSGPVSFTSNLTKLTPGTKYFVRAYATNSIGTGYGAIKTFTTEPATIPKVAFWNIDPVTLSTATLNGGKIVADGGLLITDRGFCWNTVGNPTLSDKFVSSGGGSNTFSTTITGLECNTCYFVKAYATNLTGTGYSSSLLFITTFPEVPVYPPDSIFGRWKYIYSLGGIGGGVNTPLDDIIISDFGRDSSYKESQDEVISRECSFHLTGNVLKYSDQRFLYRTKIVGDNMEISIIDTLNVPMDWISGFYYKRFK